MRPQRLPSPASWRMHPAITSGTRQTVARLKASNLAKTYRGRDVIHDVSLTVDSGQIVGLLGPNGAGKTTCFYMIIGIIPADKGTISVNGADITGLNMHQRARRGIGYLPQEASIFRKLSVGDNILAILEISMPDKKRRRDRLEELLNEFSITHIRRASALSLSGGERRRAEIARCLAANPKYLLLDEPFAGVDPIAVGGSAAWSPTSRRAGSAC